MAVGDASLPSGVFTDFVHHSDYSAGVSEEEALKMLARLDKQSKNRTKPDHRAEHAWMVHCTVCDLAGIVRAGATHYCRGVNGDQDISQKRVAGQYHVSP